MAHASIRFIAVAVLLGACGQPAALQSGTGPEPTDTGGSQQATTLEIVCTADGRTSFPSGTSVAAQRDGVHLHIDNRAGEPVSINGTRADADPGLSDVVVDDPPGTLAVACWPYSRHQDSEPPTTAVTVSDPDGLWVSDKLDCGKSAMVSNEIIDYAPSAGDPTDPLVQARRAAPRKLDDAEFARAGYPESAHPTVVARRDGRILAVYRFERGSGDGWLLGNIRAC